MAEIFERRDAVILEPVSFDQQNIFSPQMIGSPTWIHRWGEVASEIDSDQSAWWLFNEGKEKTETPRSWFQAKDSVLLRGVMVDKIRLVSRVMRSVE